MHEFKPLPGGGAEPIHAAVRAPRGVAAALRVHVRHGRAVQLESMKFLLKGPGIKRLKLNCDEPLSTVGFNFNLRHYIMFHQMGKRVADFWPAVSFGLLGYRMDRTHSIMRIATTVGRCRLTLSNPS